jgi:hypothetical protein
MTPSGYSGKPLAVKLGIKPGDRVRLVNAPADAEALLDGLPNDVTITRARTVGAADVTLWFVSNRSQLEAQIERAADVLPQGAMLWLAWPKRTSGVTTDIVEDTLRAVTLPTGLVDVKVCAISDLWSGLKFMHRTKSR